MKRTKAENQLASCASVPELFVLAFERAVDLLTGADIAALQRAPLGDLSALGWPEMQVLSKVGALLDALSQREERTRYRVREPERRTLSDALGEGALEDGRRMFLLAVAIDEHFDRYVEDRPPGTSVVSPMPPRFLAETVNPPPALGQMTPICVCRRWLKRFWYVGRFGDFTSLGRIPTPASRAPGARTVQALQTACDDGQLRVALVTWRRHGRQELRYSDASPGCFAIGGLTRAGRDGLVESLVDMLSEGRVHIAVLPELALDVTELASLRTTLAARARRFPALTVAGLAHARSADGASHVNEAVVLDARGHELLRHEKLEPYSDSGEEPRMEDILPRQSEEYVYMDTPVGRIVLNICKDFRSDVPILLNRVLGASLVLVPAYSRRLDFILEEARILGARQLAMVFGVNPLADDGLEHGTAGYVPLRGRAKSETHVQQEELRTSAADVVVQVCRVSLGDERVANLDATTRLAV